MDLRAFTTINFTHRIPKHLCDTLKVGTGAGSREASTRRSIEGNEIFRLGSIKRAGSHTTFNKLVWNVNERQHLDQRYKSKIPPLLPSISVSFHRICVKSWIRGSLKVNGPLACSTSDMCVNQASCIWYLTCTIPNASLRPATRAWTTHNFLHGIGCNYCSGWDPMYTTKAHLNSKLASRGQDEDIGCADAAGTKQQPLQ